MKFVIFLTVIMIICVRGEFSDYNDLESVSATDQFRFYLKDQFVLLLGSDMDSFCPRILPHEQTVFGNKKIDEFIACGNATIDKFVDKLDFDVKLSDISSPKTLRQYIGPMCQVFDEFFNCIIAFKPTIDLCLGDEVKLLKTFIFTAVPLLHQAVCLENGDLLADLLESDNGLRCYEQTHKLMNNISVEKLFANDNVEELFGSEVICREFNRIRLELYKKLGECSTNILLIVSQMLGYFCEGTKCNRFIRDFKCY